MPKVKKLVFSIRETVPFFVSSLRSVHKWKHFQAEQLDSLAQAEVETNVKQVKSPFARSASVENLVHFLDETVLDINCMVQLPSIEKCLEAWWKFYADSKQTIDQNILRNFYYDLASVLVKANTKTGHKNFVSLIMRSTWLNWDPKENPLVKSEFNRLLFTLAHIMTPTNRLSEYVIFFHNTMDKISRNYRQENCNEKHSRRPQSRRKLTLGENFSSDMVSSSKSISTVSSNQVSDVRIGRSYEADPLLNDRHFQNRFRQPAGNTISMNQVAVALNPINNKFCPPLLVSRLKTYSNADLSSVRWQPPDAVTHAIHNLTVSSNIAHLPASNVCRQTTGRFQNSHNSVSKPAFGGNYNLGAPWYTAPNDMRYLELTRRSLSRVTLQSRFDRNQVYKTNSTKSEEAIGSREGKKTKIVYLTITT
ncbi:hypothetical protein Plhal304r1_c032g0103261 [Plasmopara halstedii]